MNFFFILSVQNLNRNPRVNCADLPEMDLTSWRESYLPYDNNGGNGNIAVMNTIIDDYKAKSKAKAKAKA